MNKWLIACGLAALAVFAGVVYFAREPAGPPHPADTHVDAAVPVQDKKPASAPPPVSRSVPPSRPRTSDPRLAALMVSPNNDLIEFFADASGRVIKEVDNDPNSARFRMPLREYTYAGDKVIRLVTYKDLGNQVQIIEADVVYKPDGSIDKYNESTRYEQDK